MEWLSINHIPIDLNAREDGLSKKVLDLNKGTFIVQESYDDQLLEEMNFQL
jgi:hypothetical protein